MAGVQRRRSLNELGWRLLQVGISLSAGINNSVLQDGAWFNTFAVSHLVRHGQVRGRKDVALTESHEYLASVRHVEDAVADACKLTAAALKDVLYPNSGGVVKGEPLPAWTLPAGMGSEDEDEGEASGERAVTGAREAAPRPARRSGGGGSDGGGSGGCAPAGFLHSLSPAEVP